MHAWNNDWMQPPQELLDKCYEILIPDPTTPTSTIKKWAIEHCQSFVYMEEVDASSYDIMYAFYFGSEADKIMFALKWK